MFVSNGFLSCSIYVFGIGHRPDSLPIGILNNAFENPMLDIQSDGGSDDELLRP